MRSVRRQGLRFSHVSARPEPSPFLLGRYRLIPTGVATQVVQLHWPRAGVGDKHYNCTKSTQSHGRCRPGETFFDTRVR